MLGDGSRFLPFALKTSAAAVAAAFLYGLASFYLFGGRFLWLEEPRTPISDIDISTGETVTPYHLMGWLGVERESPLFPGRGFRANNLRLAREKIVSNSPTLASLSISRDFAGKVVIRATERIPLARLAGRSVAIDRDGHVFEFRSAGLGGLVAIDGNLAKSLEPGNHVVPSSIDVAASASSGRSVPSAMGVAAIRLIDFLAEGASSVPISAILSVNTDNPDYLKVTLKDGRTARLAWDCMKSSQAADGREYLAVQLNGLAGALSSRRGRGHRDFDFTIKGRGYGL